MEFRFRWLIWVVVAAAGLVSNGPGAGAAGAPAGGPLLQPASVPAGSGITPPAAPTAVGAGARSASSAASAGAPQPEADDPPEAHVRLGPRGTIELHVADADLASVLKLLSRQSRRNIVASKNVAGKVTADLYDMTLEQVLDAILGANGCGWQTRDNLIWVGTSEEMARMTAPRPTCRVFRLKHINAEEASKLIQPLLTKEGKVTATSKSLAGVAEGDKEAAGHAAAGEDVLMVMDTPEQLAVIARAIEQIDVRPGQVLIEATILRAQLNEDNALGIDFNVVGGVDFSNLDSVSTGVTDLTVGDVPENRLNDTNMAARQDVTANVPRGGFTFGIIRNDIAVFIRALEQITDTTVIANPKVLALNKQRGEVIVGRRDGYLTTTVTQTASIQTVEFLETGTQLIFRPFIEDNGYVRMEIHPKDSTGGLTASNLPYEQTTEVTTNITVRDGHTILIGGLFRDVSTSTRSQTPWLGSVPVLGWLFRGTRDNTQREEVIILLTVHLVKDEERLVAASMEALQDIERYRVGLRDGLLPFGRERLAQAHYRWAMEHLAAGRGDRALWDARIAAHLNPTFLSAIALAENLSNRRAWDSDGSAVRHFVLKQTLREKGMTGPLYDRPEPGMFPFVEPPEPGGTTADEAKDISRKSR